MTAPSPAHPPPLGPTSTAVFDSDSQSTTATQTQTQSSTLPSLARAPGVALALGGESQPTQQTQASSGWQIPGLGRLGQTRPPATAGTAEGGTASQGGSLAGPGTPAGASILAGSIAGEWQPPSAFPAAKSKIDSSLRAGEHWAAGQAPTRSTAFEGDSQGSSAQAGSASRDDGSQPPIHYSLTSPSPAQPMLHVHHDPDAADDGAYTQVHYDRSYESSPAHSASLSNDEIEASLGWGRAADDGLVPTQLATQSQSLQESGSQQRKSNGVEADAEVEDEEMQEEGEGSAGAAGQGSASGSAPGLLAPVADANQSPAADRVSSTSDSSLDPATTTSARMGRSSKSPVAAAAAITLVLASQPTATPGTNGDNGSSLSRASVSSIATVQNGSAATPKRTTPPPTPGRQGSTPPPASDDNETVPATSSPVPSSRHPNMSANVSGGRSSASLRPQRSMGPTSSGIVEGVLPGAPPPSPAPSATEQRGRTTDDSVVPDSQMPLSDAPAMAAQPVQPPSTAVPPISSSTPTGSASAQAQASAALPILHLPPRDDDDDDDDYTFGSTYRKPTASQRPAPASDDTVIPATRQTSPFASGLDVLVSSHALLRETVNPSDVFNSLIDASSDLSDLSDDGERAAAKVRKSRAARLYEQKMSSARSSKPGSAAGSSTAIGPSALAGGEGEGSGTASPNNLSSAVQRLMGKQVELDMPVAGPSRSRPRSRVSDVDMADDSRIPDSQPPPHAADDSLGPFTYIDETLPPPTVSKGKGKRPLSISAGSTTKKAKASNTQLAGPPKKTPAKGVKQEVLSQDEAPKKKAAKRGTKKNWATGKHKKKRSSAAASTATTGLVQGLDEDENFSAVPMPPPSDVKRPLKRKPSAPDLVDKGKRRASSVASVTRTSVRGFSSSPALSRRAAKATALLDSRVFTGCVDRVFALYRENKTYYPATVIDVGQVGDPSDFRVAYDEGEDQLCHVRYLRRCAVRVGDIVYHDGDAYIVQRDADRPEGLEGDVELLLKAANSSVSSALWHIKMRDVVIDHLDIGQMSDRTLEEKDMTVRGCSTTYYSSRRMMTNGVGPAGPSSGLVNPSPTRSRSGGLRSTSVTAPTSGSNIVRGRLFAGKAFVKSFVSGSDAVGDLVTTNGGQYVDELSEFYRIEGATAAGSLPNNTYVGEHLKFAPAARDIQGVFLLADSATRRPKAFKALALGVPCIATTYIRDALEAQAAGEPTPLDWRAYKLATPPSCVTGIDPNTGKGNASSQSFIHHEWGTSHAIARNPLQSTPDSLARPFRGLAFLYLNRTKSERELIVFLILALGAGSVTVAADETKVGDLHKYDVVVLRDDEPAPSRLHETGVLADSARIVDEEWVKQSVIVGHRVAFKLWKPVKDATEAAQAALVGAAGDHISP